MCTFIFPVLNENSGLKGDSFFFEKMKCQWQESGNARIIFDNQTRLNWTNLALTKAF